MMVPWGYIHAFLSAAVFPQDLVSLLFSSLAPMVGTNSKILKFRSQDYWKMHFRHSF